MPVDVTAINKSKQLLESSQSCAQW